MKQVIVALVLCVAVYGQVIVHPTSNTFNESSEDTSITIELVNPNARGRIRYILGITDPNDVTASNGVLRFRRADASMTIPLTIIDDTEIEGDEIFLLRLIDVNGEIVNDTTIIFTIIDNDFLTITSDTLSVSEESGAMYTPLVN